MEIIYDKKEINKEEVYIIKVNKNLLIVLKSNSRWKKK